MRVHACALGYRVWCHVCTVSRVCNGVCMHVCNVEVGQRWTPLCARFGAIIEVGLLGHCPVSASVHYVCVLCHVSNYRAHAVACLRTHRSTTIIRMSNG